MRQVTTIILLTIAILVCGNLAFAQSEGCDCQKGGLGLKIGKFVAAFGARSFYNLPGCDTFKGVGIGIGGEGGRFQIGFGYNTGTLGVGFGFKNPDTTSVAGFSIGYDYGKCQLVFPPGYSD